MCICVWTFANKFLRNGKTRSAQGPTWVRCTSARDSDAATLRRARPAVSPPGEPEESALHVTLNLLQKLPPALGNTAVRI